MFAGGLGALMVGAPRLVRAETAPDGFQVLRAKMQDGNLMDTPGTKTSLWRFASDDPVTVLTARQGEEFKVRIINTLTQEIWLHWFGVRGASEQMTVNVPPGEDNAVDCVFTPPDAGTFWFGPLTQASQQREMGLYGVLVVNEATAPAPLHDLTLVVDDWKINDDGSIVDDFGNLELAVGEGRLGNWFTVNGQYRPHFKLPADQACRLRLLNAANVRTMNLQFKGQDPLLVALDGQPLAPQHTGHSSLSLAPGQRMDLVIDAGNDPITLALDLFEDVVELCYLDRPGSAGPDVLADNFALPANPLSIVFKAEAAKTVAVKLEGGTKGGLKSARYNNEDLDLRVLLEKGKAWAVNGVVGPGGAPLGSFTKGDSVIFDIDNTTAFEQPLHIHGHVWQVIAVDGAEKTAEPWRDTAVVPAKAKMQLAFIADNPGVWALQSLVAERVDAGLLASFKVE
jgi:FtsP/CotA-like multicopper oxidase with cupredoxin domain